MTAVGHARGGGVTPARHAEMARLFEQKGGALEAKDVVEFARDPATAMHSYFEWDDGVAGERYREIQARAFIRVMFAVVERPNQEPLLARFAVSLPQEPGYRRSSDVMADADLRRRYVDSVARDLKAIGRKHESITEFAAIYAEIDKLS